MGTPDSIVAPPASAKSGPREPWGHRHNGTRRPGRTAHALNEGGAQERYSALDPEGQSRQPGGRRPQGIELDGEKKDLGRLPTAEGRHQHQPAPRHHVIEHRRGNDWARPMSIGVHDCRQQGRCPGQRHEGRPPGLDEQGRLRRSEKENYSRAQEQWRMDGPLRRRTPPASTRPTHHRGENEKCERNNSGTDEPGLPPEEGYQRGSQPHPRGEAHGSYGGKPAQAAAPGRRGQANEERQARRGGQGRARALKGSHDDDRLDAVRRHHRPAGQGESEQRPP